MKNYIQPEIINYDIVALNSICITSRDNATGDPNVTEEPKAGNAPGRILYV